MYASYCVDVLSRKDAFARIFFSVIIQNTYHSPLVLKPELYCRRPLRASWYCKNTCIDPYLPSGEWNPLNGYILTAVHKVQYVVSITVCLKILITQMEWKLQDLIPMTKALRVSIWEAELLLTKYYSIVHRLNTSSLKRFHSFRLNIHNFELLNTSRHWNLEEETKKISFCVIKFEVRARQYHNVFVIIEIRFTFTSLFNTL